MRFGRLAVLTVGLLVVLWCGLGAALRQPAWRGLPSRGAPTAVEERLRRDVFHLAGDLVPRDVQHPERLERAAAYVATELAAAGAEVVSQPVRTRRGEFRNLIASLGPDVGPRVIVGAHYDAFGEFGENPGADDNASGTAGLLELARLLRDRPLGRRVELVAFTTEEPPFFAGPEMGSAVHARSLQAARSPAAAMLCLEMIGYYSESQPWPSALFRLVYPSTGDFVAVVGRWQDRALARRVRRAMIGGGAAAYSYSGPSIAGMDASDHRSYWALGTPAVLITDTAFLRNGNYHAPGDRPETLDYQRLAHTIDGVANAVLWLAGEAPHLEP